MQLMNDDVFGAVAELGAAIKCTPNEPGLYFGRAGLYRSLCDEYAQQLEAGGRAPPAAGSVADAAAGKPIGDVRVPCGSTQRHSSRHV